MNTSRVSRRQVLRGLSLIGAATALLPRNTVQAQEAAGVPTTTPPTAAPPPPAFYRFNVGDFEATVVSDGFHQFPAPFQPTWAPQAKAGELDAALREAFLPTDRLELAFNVLLVRTGRETVLVDAGSGTQFVPTTGRLLAGMTAAGVRPEDVTAVFLTHAHLDHLGGLLDASGQPVFSRAQYFVAAPEWDFWTAPDPDLSTVRQSADVEKKVRRGRTETPAHAQGSLQTGSARRNRAAGRLRGRPLARAHAGAPDPARPFARRGTAPRRGHGAPFRRDDPAPGLDGGL